MRKSLKKYYTINLSFSFVLGFDPFFETQKGLAELLENEMMQQSNHKILENCQRTRMPPPGFNHMNAFGFGVPRAQSSKILPFMNNISNNSQQQQQQQQQTPQTNNWGQPNLGGYQQQPPQMPTSSQHDQNHLGLQNHQSNKSGCFVPCINSVLLKIIIFYQLQAMAACPTGQH